jgi:tryptophan-rich sensory protein
MVEFVSGLVTQSSVGNWYKLLIKPYFTPPNWIFGPIWTLLYLMMGFAWGNINNCLSDSREIKKANILFVFQLFLNALWSIIYFGLRNINYALIDIILLWLAIVVTMYQFFKISKLSGWLLVPYLLWTSYALILNASICYLNK